MNLRKEIRKIIKEQSEGPLSGREGARPDRYEEPLKSELEAEEKLDTRNRSRALLQNISSAINNALEIGVELRIDNGHYVKKTYVSGNELRVELYKVGGTKTLLELGFED